jgi:uncharacterized protein (TIRG00374 family)
VSPNSNHGDAPSGASIPEGVSRANYVKRAMIGVAAAIVVVTVMTIAGDARDLGTALKAFDWRLIAPILLLTLWNYALRFLKWDWFLRLLGVRGLSKIMSLRIFLSGFAMSITPGKVGEFIKAVYVRRKTGQPINRVMAVVTAERVTDAAAMAVLGVIGAARYAYGREFLAAFIVLGIGGVVLLQRPALTERGITWSSRYRPMAKIADHLRAFFDASASLLRLNVFLPAVAISTLSWAGECLAFFLVLVGLGLHATFDLLLVATFILAISSLAGGISMLPGGLGVADASAVGMLLLLVNDDAMTRSVAVAATLLIRFATLWFAVFIGAGSLALIERNESHSLARLAESRGDAG